MRLLLDQNLSFNLCARLADLYPGSTQGRLLGLDRADDRRPWAQAGAGRFVFVTQDANFAEMAALYGPPPNVIWLQGGNRPTAAVEGVLRRNHAIIRDFAEDQEAACLQIGEGI